MRATKIDFTGGWYSLWSHLSVGINPQFLQLMTWAGVALIVWSLVRWVIARQRGRQEKLSGLMWTLVLGSMLAAPTAVIPIVLTVADIIANLVVDTVGSIS